MQTKWEGPYLYEPKSGNDWFVWFRYRNPHTGKMERFKCFIGFSEYKTKTAKRYYGSAMVVAFKRLLKDGYSPYQGEEPEEVKITVVFAITKYLNQLEASDNTIKKYTVELSRFKKWLIKNKLGSLHLSEVTKTMVTEFLEQSRQEKSWSPKTYNSYLNDITTFFNHYHRNYDDIIDKVPTKTLSRKKADRPGNAAFTDWQFGRLKELMHEHDDGFIYTFCSFVYYGALRNEAEAVFIKAGDFNLNTKTLKIPADIAKNRTTEYIPLYPEFIELIKMLGIHDMDSNLYVFGKTDLSNSPTYGVGMPIPVGKHYFGEQFRKYKKMLDLPKRTGIYCYKHTRAVHLGEDGEDLYKIMKLFRHRDLATTMIYMRDLGINTQGSDYTKGRAF